MHSFPTHVPQQRHGREAPAEGEGGGAWGMPCSRRRTLPHPGLRTPEHRPHHHPHERSFPSGDGQHDRSTGRPRPRRPGANDDRTSARRPGGRRRGKRSRPHDEPFSPTKLVHGRGSRKTCIRGPQANDEKIPQGNNAPPNCPRPQAGPRGLLSPQAGGTQKGPQQPPRGKHASAD